MEIASFYVSLERNELCNTAFSATFYSIPECFQKVNTALRGRTEHGVNCALSSKIAWEY